MKCEPTCVWLDYISDGNVNSTISALEVKIYILHLTLDCGILVLYTRPEETDIKTASLFEHVSC